MPFFKKAFGKIYNVEYSRAEQKAMNMEIQRQCAEYDRKHMDEIDAMILWTLHKEFGFGEARLKRFHDAFIDRFKEMTERFEIDDDEGLLWIYTKMLKEEGIDISSWSKEDV